MDNLKGKTVSLAHGAGGKQTSELIDQVFKAHFANPELTSDDAAVLKMKEGKIAFTTDGFIVSPSEFPGGNIGKLSICGTVNDLSCMGAKPLYLSCAFVIEEGFPMEKLEAIAAAMEKTAKEAGVKIVAGDTKVAGKGQVDGVFITTTGIGEIQEGVETSGFMAKPGDAVIVSGGYFISDEGCTRNPRCNTRWCRNRFIRDRRAEPYRNTAECRGNSSTRKRKRCVWNAWIRAALSCL